MNNYEKKKKRAPKTSSQGNKFKMFETLISSIGQIERYKKIQNFD